MNTKQVELLKIRLADSKKDLAKEPLTRVFLWPNEVDHILTALDAQMQLESAVGDFYIHAGKKLLGRDLSSDEVDELIHDYVHPKSEEND